MGQPLHLSADVIYRWPLYPTLPSHSPAGLLSPLPSLSLSPVGLYLSIYPQCLLCVMLSSLYGLCVHRRKEQDGVNAAGFPPHCVAGRKSRGENKLRDRIAFDAAALHRRHLGHKACVGIGKRVMGASRHIFYKAGKMSGLPHIR